MIKVNSHHTMHCDGRAWNSLIQYSLWLCYTNIKRQDSVLTLHKTVQFCISQILCCAKSNGQAFQLHNDGKAQNSRIYTHIYTWLHYWYAYLKNIVKMTSQFYQHVIWQYSKLHVHLTFLFLWEVLKLCKYTNKQYWVKCLLKQILC